MSFEKLALRAFAYSGCGTLIAVLVNVLLGSRANVLVASILGAAIGSILGWLMEQRAGRAERPTIEKELL